MSLFLSVLEQGMIYAIMGLGVYITYKILDFPDLTVDGSFPLGASIAAAMISRDMNPLLAVLVSFLAGAAVGICTGVIHVKFRVRDLLAGIIMMTALYTVHIRTSGRANLPIYGKATIFDNDLVNRIFSGSMKPYATVVIIFIITMISKYLLDWYLSTKSGFMLRAVGDNETIVTSTGLDKGMIKIIGLSISNALVTMSGCIYAQQQRFYDASMGPGTVVIGLASVIIGLSLFKKMSFMRVTSSVVIGSILYKACVALAIKAGLPSTDLKMITAILFLVILIVTMDRKKKRVSADQYYGGNNAGNDDGNTADNTSGNDGTGGDSTDSTDSPDISNSSDSVDSPDIANSLDSADSPLCKDRENSTDNAVSAEKTEDGGTAPAAVKDRSTAQKGGAPNA